MLSKQFQANVIKALDAITGRADSGAYSSYVPYAEKNEKNEFTLCSEHKRGRIKREILFRDIINRSHSCNFSLLRHICVVRLFRKG